MCTPLHRQCLFNISLFLQGRIKIYLNLLTKKTLDSIIPIRKDENSATLSLIWASSLIGDLPTTETPKTSIEHRDHQR